MSYEAKFKELTSDSGMGVYGQAELLGREADNEICRLRVAEKMLFQVMLTINNCKHNENNLPDSFDEQLCEGIVSYFNGDNQYKEGEG